MHREAYKFVESAVELLALERALSTTVIELGSLDVNGSVRGLFGGCSFTGIDSVPGRSVDQVADAAEWPGAAIQSQPLVDVVVTCECLEHADTAERVLQNAARLVRPGGWLIVTCAIDPRAPHHAASPWYRNPAVDELRAWTAPSFEAMVEEVHRERGDYYLLARRRDWRLPVQRALGSCGP